ncbi:MAG TPA: histidine phosphatase family protein [Chthonomonadales bacterium]|nr:histidine phosphatase family protein [Chthonomonadales bacterium]
MRELLVVRHGLVHNPQGVAYGRLPGFHLAERGREEAAQAAAFLTSFPPGKVHHSPLERAVETAAIVAAPHGAPLCVDHRLIEDDGSEPPEAVAARMRSFWEDWLATGSERDYAVSHREPIRALLLDLAGIDVAAHLRDLAQFPLGTAGVYRVRAAGSRPVIDRVFEPPS